MMLNKKIQQFYDQSTPLWLSLWGEHMHQGFYGNKNQREKKTFAQAQKDLIAELLQWGEINKAAHILDAGCGVGGTARLLANKFKAKVLGMTLSPAQAAKGNQYSKAAGLDHYVTIEAGDMMNLKDTAQKFDLICAIESGDYIADKAALLKLFYDLLKPGGRLLIAGWHLRDEPSVFEKSESALLEKIYASFHFPSLVSLNTLAAFGNNAGFHSVKTEGWSDGILPFWQSISNRLFRPASVIAILKAGLPAFKSVWALRYMERAYRNRLIRYGVMQGTKDGKPQH